MLKKKFREFNTSIDIKEVSKINELKENTILLKNNLLETTNNLNRRSAEMMAIQKKAEDLKDNSDIFFKITKKIKSKYDGTEYTKYILLIFKIFLLIAFVYLLSSYICGGFLMQNCID